MFAISLLGSGFSGGFLSLVHLSLMQWFSPIRVEPGGVYKATWGLIVGDLLLAAACFEAVLLHFYFINFPRMPVFVLCFI